MKPSHSTHTLEKQGMIIKKTTGTYLVDTEAQVLTCTLAVPVPGGKRARQSQPVAATAETVVVGDRVRLRQTQPGAGQIVEILPRRNSLARRAAGAQPGASDGEQLIAANVDQVVPVFACADPLPKWKMLDRYLVLAEAAGIPALICITKLDLLSAASRADFNATLDDYRRIGYPVVLTSIPTGQGLDELRQALSGRISVLLGKSGVGKTSILNGVQSGLGLRVQAVSQATGKGRHTTTHQEMFFLEGGGAIVDTPGVREFGLWEVDESDLALYFPEMRPLVGQCRFGLDCSHNEEPGCVIRKAVMAGEISPYRYQSYLRLRQEA